MASWLQLNRRPGLRAALLVDPLVWIGLSFLLHLRPSTAVLIAWDAAVLAHLGFSIHALLGASPERTRQEAEALDEGRWGVLGGTIAAVLMSLVAVGLDLAGAKNGVPAWNAALAVATVLLSWTIVHVLFAIHYLHEHSLRGGIEFPGNDDPDLLEFLYLGFTVGMTAQVSDVTTASAGMRRLVLAHGVVSFLFNAAVVAGAVNLAAGLAS